MASYDEIRSRTGGYSGIMIGGALSEEESRSLGLPVANPMINQLREEYERHVTENPDEAAARAWDAERVGVPLWVQERSDMYTNEAKTRLALLEKGTPDWKKLADASPVTASFMLKDGVMAAAYDDTNELASIEDVTHSLAYMNLNYKDKLAFLARERRAPQASIPTLDIKGQPGMLASLSSALASVRDWLSDPRSGEKNIERLRQSLGMDGMSSEEQMRAIGERIARSAAADFRALPNLGSDTSFGKGIASGYEMSAIGTEAWNLFNSEMAGGAHDEAKWVELEKRRLALDREKPEGWFSGMLYETGKFLGQQAQGSWTTGLMSATGGALGGYAATLGAAGLLGSAAFLPVTGVVALGAAAGWWLGARAGVFTQSAKTEGGLDIIDRRMMRGADGEYISNLAAGLGSLAVGAVNGALELFEWNVAGRPFTSAVRRVVPQAALRDVSEKVAARVAALPHASAVGRAVSDWGSNVLAESATEVLQEIVPITIDEMQKHALLGGYDARTLGEISADLTETFTSSLYSFALISAIGPAAGLAAGRYSGEFTRRDYESARTKLFNEKMDSFKERVGASKIFSRYPSMSRAHRDEVLSNADLSRAYIGAEKVETLFQQGLLPKSEEYESAAAWAEDYLGVSEDEYNESMQTGYEMELEAAKLFDAVESAGEGKTNGIYDALAKDIRFSRNGMTLAEAEASDKRISELRREDFFNIAAGMDMARQEEDSSRRVYEAGRMQLEASGVDTETAQADAYIKSRMYVPLARMYDSALGADVKGDKRILAEDIEKMFPLVVERDETGAVSGITGGATLTQPLRIFERARAAIKSVFDAAMADKTTHKIESLGGVQKWLADAVIKSRGIDISGYSHNIDTSSVRHIIKQHGDAQREAARGQIAVTEEDLLRIPEIIASPDFIVLGTKNRIGNDGVIYVKNMPDNSTLYIEEIRGKKSKQLTTDTMWKMVGTSDAQSLRNAPTLYARGDANSIEIIANPAKDNNDADVLSTYYQPVNDGVNLNEKVRGVVVKPSLSFEDASKVKTKSFKKDFARKLAGTYHNEDTGWNIDLSISNVSHAVSSALNNSVVDFETSVNILEGLPDIIRSAKLIESHADRHGQEQVQQVHRLFASVKLANDADTIYTVKLTVKQMGEKYVAAIENIYRAYDAKVEKKASDLARAPLPRKEVRTRHTSEAYEISISDMLKSVNDNAGVPYLNSSRGSISFPQYAGAPITIHLGKDADRSTFAHEMSHLYFWHLRNLASLDTVQNSATWQGPQARWNKELATITSWWGENAEDIARQAGEYADGLSAQGFQDWLASGMERESAAGAAYERASQEYFARGFEKYLTEGKAPSKDLLSVFRRFKKWLCEIYKTLKQLNVELSDDIRGVYDRMLATDEAIEQLRAEREVDAAIAAEREEAEAFAEERDPEEMEDEYDFGDDPYEAAKESLLGTLLSEDTGERRRAMTERAEEIRPGILSEVLSEPGYRALSMMEQAPELRLNPEAVMDAFSETVVAAMPEGSLAENGMTDLETAARALNFNSAREMIDAIAGRRTIKEEVDARVREAVAREFTDTMSSPAAMEAAAEAAMYDNDEQGEALAADTEADFDEALEADTRDEQREAEFRTIFEADEAAQAEEQDPSSRTNVEKWMRKHGRPRYSYVAREMGKEDAQALLLRYGPGFFSKDGRGLDDIAQELDGMGISVGGEAGLFNLLMSDEVPESPLEVAKREGRREVMDQYRGRYEKYIAKAERRSARNEARIKRIEEAAQKKVGRAKARYEAAAERMRAQMKATRERATALRKEIKEKYQQRKTELEARYKAMDEKRRAAFIEQKNRERTRRALDRYLKQLQNGIKNRENRSELTKAAKLSARNIVTAMSIRDLYDVTGWVRVEKDSRAAAERALRNFDEEAFRAARRKELHAHETVKAMYRARRRADYIRGRLAKYSNRGRKQTFGMTPEYIYQLDMLLSRFDFGRRTKREIEELTPADMRREAKSLAEFMDEQNKAGVPLLIPDWIAQSESQMMYEGLKTYELEDVFNAVRNLLQVGRDEKKTIAREKNIELAKIDQAVLERAQSYFGEDKVDGKMHIETARKDPNVVADVLLDLNTIEAMCRALDGYKDDGPMQDFFFRPVREAVSREYEELNVMFGKFRELKERIYGANFKADMKKRDIGVAEYVRHTDPETGRVYHVATQKHSLFTQENIICAAFNMGNEGNLARLRDGWGWTDSDIEKIKAQMTQRDWEYVQGVWDLLEEMWPQIKKVAEYMTGMTIEKVEAKPVVTQFGTFRGGYYPIVTDLRYSERAAAQNEQQEILASAPMQYGMKYTKNGHTKARAENVLGRPPLLSFSVLDNHIANVIHDYEMAPVLRDVGKILSRDTIKSVIVSVYGDRGYRNFKKWLNDIAANTKNNGVATGSGDRIVNGIKSKTAMFALGGNMVGALTQMLGYFPLAHRIGFVNTALAIGEALNPFTKTYDFAREKSAFMREQMNDGNSEVRKLRQNWTTNDHGISKAADMMLSIYPLFQNMCNVPGWVQCYKIGMKRYGNEKKAIAYADSIIRQTQSASTIADLTSFERSGTIGQLTTMFYSWFRVMYQMQNEAIMRVKYEHGINKIKDLASYAFYILVAQSVAEALIRREGLEPDDDESRLWSWAKWTAARALIVQPLSTVPFAREFASAIDNNFQFGVQLTPAQGGLDAIARLLRIAIKQSGNLINGDDVDWGDVAEAGATVVGYRYGVPNRKMIIAAKAFWKYFDEDEAIPWAYLFLGSGYKPQDD